MKAIYNHIGLLLMVATAISCFICSSNSTRLVEIGADSWLISARNETTNSSAKWSSHHHDHSNSSRPVASIHLIKSFVYDAIRNGTNTSTGGLINVLLNQIKSLANLTNLPPTNNRTISTLIIIPVNKTSANNTNETNNNNYNRSAIIEHIKQIVNSRLTPQLNNHDDVYLFKIVSVEKSPFNGSDIDVFNKTINFNKSVMRLIYLQQLIEHAILKHFGSRLRSIHIGLTVNNSTEKNVTMPCKLPLEVRVSLTSPQLRIREKDFVDALIKFSSNENKCYLMPLNNSYNNNNWSNSTSNETSVDCFYKEKKDRFSLLRVADLWIELDNGNATDPFMERLTSEAKIFSYQPAWIVGLIVIGCIVALFFIGCIFAVCYTRRPYRRASKIYEVDSGKAKHVPQIPGINPAVQAAKVKTRQREFYY